MQLIAWLDRHAAPIAVALLILTLIARAVAAIYGPTHPRLRAAVEALGALSPDPVRTIAQVYEALTGRQLAPLWLLLGDVLRRPEAAPSSPPEAGRPTHPPDETTRSMRRPGAGTLGAMCLLLAVGLAPLGCAASNDAASIALKAGVTVLEGSRAVRRYVCSRALDSILGDPREHEVSAAPSSSGGSSAPSSPAAPPPVPLPAAPPPPSAPRVEEDAGGVPGDAAAPAGTDGRP